MSLYSKLLSTSSKAKIAGLKISKTDSNPAAITIDEESQKVLNNILSKFRRCLCKKVADNEVKICYLDDTNSNFYHDRTPSILTGEEGDVMVYFPEFWYKGTDTDTDYVWNFSETYVEGYHHAPASLVGAYKGYQNGGKLHSISGVDSRVDSNISAGTFHNLAISKGQGYHIIDYQQHCIIVWMFYARYKNRNSQLICGSGPNKVSGVLNGTTNVLGIKDTTNPTSNDMLVNFLGIEGCWGYNIEWIEGIHLQSNEGIIAYDKGYYFGHSLSSIPVSSKRLLASTNNPTNGTNGYLSSIKGGEFQDMIGLSYSGSNNTYFCDYSWGTIEGYNLEYRRSGSASELEGGVSFIYNGSTAWPTSRLAFDGNILVVDDVATFKALPIL